eukprot:Seg318.20 transcript_id=Seg318.20/GoldUCD/mRNA.D3Y31 product="Glutathione S-transferase Yb-3" protein_id=Seg318.20/GoldUCD/D3Y31
MVPPAAKEFVLFTRERQTVKTQEKEMAPTLAYWKIRGLAQPLRLILGYSKADFEDKCYEQGDGPEFDISCWTSVKFDLGLDFPNLPYYIDGDIKITQSNAILRYLGRKFKLDGETEEEKRRVDLMENQAMDFRNAWVGLCYNPKFDEMVDGYKKKIGPMIQKFSDYLGERKFFAGEKLTMVDFVMYELLDQHKAYDDSFLEPHKNLQDFLKRFEAIPEIAEFQKSEKCFKGPINNKVAKFK